MQVIFYWTIRNINVILSNMKSMRALKRKSKKSSIVNKENITKMSESCPNLKNVVVQHSSKIRKTKSESDIAHSSLDMITSDLKLHAKSVRNLKSVYVNDEILSPTTTSSTLSADNNNRHRMEFVSSTPIVDNIMQASSFSVISDRDQLKIPIVGYEVMEERSRFTVSWFSEVKSEKLW